MKKYASVAVAAVLVVVLAGAAWAQAPSGPPKPGPEHEKLAYFAGKWVSEGETKPSAFGPAGKFTSTDICEWFAGRFAIVCHSEGKTQEGAMKELSIMGYDRDEKTYVYFYTNSRGETGFSRGTVAGDTWTWTSEGKMEGKVVRARFTLKQVSADSATYKLELASGSEPLQLIMEGKQTRQK